jgi:hypothetical protein
MSSMSNTDDMTAPVNNAGLEILQRLISGMTATERFVLSFYADGSPPYAHTVHNLNASNVLSQIKDSMGPLRNISPDGELRNSDSSLLYHLRTTTSLTHWVLVRQPDDIKKKGVPQETIDTYCKDNEISRAELHEKLVNGETVTFNLAPAMTIN